MPNYKISVEQIDDLLPQTQCGDCGFAGCLPYAKAIVNYDEAINKCPPGGIRTLKKLAELTEQTLDATTLSDMLQKEKTPTVAFIRSSECIGCTKCIQACPVDAIMGSAKQLHIVIKQECTGCGLCVAPCPVDCIDMLKTPGQQHDSVIARERFQARNIRIAKEKKLKSSDNFIDTMVNTDKKAEILAALARAKLKKAAQENNN